MSRNTKHGEAEDSSVHRRSLQQEAVGAVGAGLSGVHHSCVIRAGGWKVNRRKVSRWSQGGGANTSVIRGENKTGNDQPGLPEMRSEVVQAGRLGEVGQAAPAPESAQLTRVDAAVLSSLQRTMR